MTARLATLAKDHWRDLDGYVTAHGGPDLLRVPLARFCSVVYWWWTRNGDSQQIAKFESQLWRPPAGEVPRGPWAPEAEASAFAGLKAGLGLR